MTSLDLKILHVPLAGEGVGMRGLVGHTSYSQGCQKHLQMSTMYQLDTQMHPSCINNLLYFAPLFTWLSGSPFLRSHDQGSQAVSVTQNDTEA